MIRNETIDYRGKDYKVITVENNHFCASFASTDLYDELYSDYNDGEHLNDDHEEVWNEIYYFTDLVDKYDGAEFVKRLFVEEKEIKEMYNDAN